MSIDDNIFKGLKTLKELGMEHLTYVGRTYTGHAKFLQIYTKELYLAEVIKPKKPHDRRIYNIIYGGVKQ